MTLSDLAVRRPVLATVASLLIVVLGIASMLRLPVRELPDIDAAAVRVVTAYVGAAPEILDTEVIEVIEGAIAGVSGIDTIESTSRFGRASTTVTFEAGRDIDEAANDVRAAVARIRNQLPDDVDEPQVFKNDDNSDPVMRIGVLSDRMTPAELTDFAERYIIDRLSVIDGVADVEISGARSYAIRIWLDRRAMAARNLTVQDIDDALRRNNLELPAGELNSTAREFVIRTDSRLREAEEFRNVVVDRSGDHPVRLGDIARIELGVEDNDTIVRANGREGVGLQVLRQSQSNTIQISNRVRAEIDALQATLPEGMELIVGSDDAIFIRQSIEEVARTLAIAVVLVIAVIWLFLGTVRATLVPAVTIPVSLIGAFIGIAALGFSINILTLLALILAIGLVVDDAIVVLENIQRRIELGEPPRIAALLGSREVTFAVIATTLTLVAVFVPISFLDGQVGKLFREFGFVLAIAVAISTFVALTLCPPLCAAFLKSHRDASGLVALIDRSIDGITRLYRWILGHALRMPLVVTVAGLALAGSSWWLYQQVPQELTPPEDRGVFFIIVTAPEGSNIAFTDKAVKEIVEMIEPLRVEQGIGNRLFAITGARGSANSAFVVMGLTDWRERTVSVQEIVGKLRRDLGSVAAVRAFPIAPNGLGIRGSRQPLQIVIGGPDFDSVEAWTNELARAMETIDGITDIEIGYRENSPQLRVAIDRERADDLGISIEDISSALQTMLASREITAYVDRGREYPVIVQAEDRDRRTPSDLSNIFLRAGNGDLVALGALVEIEERATAPELTRLDRLRSSTIGASLADGLALGAAIDEVDRIAAGILPPEARLTYAGQAKEFLDSSGGILIVFGLAVLVVFLVLAAQFESFVHPVTIMLAVPLALTGALLSLWLTGNSLNIYTKIGVILLVGIVAKNGILIVEFANQLMERGRSAREAALEAAVTRFRPILMTVLSTILGALPLVYSSGAGAESRSAIGLVIVGGLALASFFNLIVTPVLYDQLARFVRPRNAIDQELAEHLGKASAAETRPAE